MRRNWTSSVYVSPEEQRKQREHCRSATGWHDPDTMPIVSDADARGYHVAVHDVPRQIRSNQHPDAVGDECNEPLRRGANVGGSLLIDVNLPGDEEKIVANTVEDDAAIQHPDERHVVPVG